MCIRDRVSTQSTWGLLFDKRTITDRQRERRHIQRVREEECFLLQMSKITVVISRESDRGGEGKMITIDPNWTLSTLLQRCGAKLDIDAKRILLSDGTVLSGLMQLSEGDQLYISDVSASPNFYISLNAEKIFPPFSLFSDFFFPDFLEFLQKEEVAKSRSLIQTESIFNDEIVTKNVPMNEVFTVALMGAATVGKSAITLRFTANIFQEEYVSTIEDNFKRVTSVNGKPCEIDILDTAGEEEFESLRTTWMEKREAFVLVYSVDKRKTFEELNKFYKLLAFKHPNKEFLLVIVGNKIDLPEETRQVKREDGEAFAREHNAKFFETSAKTNINIDQIFLYLVSELRKRRISKTKQSQPKKKSFWDYCSLI
eukprot:TRINITY_DN4608_c0_g1_i1.p1 TRINITY_DN4608_c0_g1~~TRINITY_DN4608_c0_g1_i1.p1  ORF type:complete len:370 (+),score=79.57 TRINITY_DN4608_c0_g1_i1:64-1173(+)